MKKSSRSARIQEAEYRAVHDKGLDYVIESIDLKEYVEVTGKAGGDTITYRFYNDGKVVEK